jgi:phenylpropionate dioxygenase-like ring-hydroxylating dioxygenase large terminal subunit
MSVTVNAAPEWADWIQPHRVHSRIYDDEAVYARELDRIWQGGWVAIGHVSELKDSGDYLRRTVAGQPLLVARGRDGNVRVLFNKCSHRGNLVCEAMRGNATSFRCPYHGWTFDTAGKLLGTPFSRGYGAELDKASLAMREVAAVDTYQGFLFVSLLEPARTLRQHLGRAAQALDRLAEFSPEGQVELSAGWLKAHAQADWKMVIENVVDGYHPKFVHKSVFALIPEHQFSDIYSESSLGLARDLGDGHTELDFRADYRAKGEPLRWIGTSAERHPEYVDQLLVEGAPHVMIWPNLLIAEIFAMIVEPAGVGASIQHTTPIQFAGAGRMNLHLLRQFEGGAGPAGLLLADDSAMFERNQIGLAAGQPEWLTLTRGLEREHVEADGTLASNATDETSLRGIWRQYRKVMLADGAGDNE